MPKASQDGSIMGQLFHKSAARSPEQAAGFFFRKYTAARVAPPALPVVLQGIVQTLMWEDTY